jgi:hypothetical protein
LLSGGSWLGWAANAPNAYAFLRAIWFINCALLLFNLLPIYPLDGGQILRSLLWYLFGRARSLMVASIIGFIGVAGLMALALALHSIWIGIVAVFILLNCWRGLLEARLLGRVANLPRRAGYACPTCREPPVSGLFWRCDHCLKPFDPFETQAVCPHCGAQFPTTRCPDCGDSHPVHEWLAAPPLVTH